MYSRGFEEKKLCVRISPRNLKILLIINYAILLSALFIALIIPPVNGYEFSIYDAYPNYFWCFIVSSIFLSYFCAVLAVLDNSTSKYWPLGFLAAVITNSLLLFLPIIRGYFIYGSGDVLAHIGYMRDIEYYGSIGYNQYPVLHILGFSVHEIAGLPFDTITMIVPPIFSILSILYWYILGREVFNNNLGVLFLVILGSLPSLGTSNSLFAPNFQANLFMPLILYGIIKSQNAANKREMGIILITISVLIVFFHPLVAIMVMLIYALLHLSDKFLCLLNKPSMVISPSKPHTSNVWVIIAIMVIIFSIWSTYLYSLANVLDPLISSIMGNEAVESEIMAKLNLVSMVDVDIIYLVKLGLFIYGIDAILGLLSLICISYLFIQCVRKEIAIDRFSFFSIVCFAVFFTLGVIIFFAINEFGYSRIYNIAQMFSLLIISSTIVTIYTRFQNIDNLKKILLCALICASIIMLIVLSVFTLHLSPNVKQANQQVPEGDYYGMTTFFEKRDNSIDILESGISQRRYYDSICGVIQPKINIRSSQDLLPLDHFGYGSSYALGSNYNKKQYFLLTPLGRHFYENIYPEFPDKWRFTDGDFERLELDSSVLRIYSNEDLEIYLIDPSYTINIHE